MNTGAVNSGNFKNPIGLLFRMLTSGHRVAYSTLLREVMRLVSWPLDRLLAGREKKLLAIYCPRAAPLILIVGAPRSGTTLVYQVLSRYLDVTYFSNLTSLFPSAPLAGTLLTRWLPHRNTADFKNFYGQTAGLNGPNDGFTVWNRWLGENRYESRTNLSGDEQRSMQQFFRVWCATFGKPLLNKNNRNTSCMNLLSQALPQATFLVVRRNPLLVAQSLIRARQQVQGAKSESWGLHSRSTSKTDDTLAYVDDVCDQVLQIEAELKEQLKSLPPDRLVAVTYEDFCKAPEASLRLIASRIPGLNLKDDLIQAELRPFAISAAETLSEAEKQRVLSRFPELKIATADLAPAAATSGS